MKRLKDLAMKNSIVACIYFAGMMIAASAPMLTIYLILLASE